MSAFQSEFWLLVPATTGTNEIVFQFLNQHGGGDDYQESVRCVDGSRPVVKNGWAIYDFGKLETIIRSAKAKKVSFEVFHCKEGETEGEPWENIWEAGKRTLRRKRRLSGAAALASA